MPEATTLAIIIVSHNVRDELDACLRSLAGASDVLTIQVTVVDNGSNDGTLAMIEERWPDVRVIDAGGNLGFARANNLGIRATRSEYVLLLNPDTIVPPGALPRLVAALAAAPGAAAAGPRLVDGDGRPELSFGRANGALGELRQKVIGALYARRVASAVAMVERWTREPGPRDWVTAACLLVRRTDLDAVGQMDERYFMYMEDIDLCVALRQKGQEVLFVPEAEVLHLRGRSAGRNPETERLRRKSQLAYYAKHHPALAPLVRLYLRATGRPVD